MSTLFIKLIRHRGYILCQGEYSMGPTELIDEIHTIDTSLRVPALKTKKLR